MTISRWTVTVLFSAISCVSCRPKGVFDSIMSPTFMQPYVNHTMLKPDDLFDDFFDKKTSNEFSMMARSASAAGDGLSKFNFSAVVPMSRSSSSSTVVSSHTSTNSQSIDTFPKKSDTQGVNITKSVENVQLIMPKSSSSTIQEIRISTSNNPGSQSADKMFGFVGPTAEKDLLAWLAAAKPIYLNGLTGILTKANLAAGQYFTVFPVKGSSPSTFYVISNTLPASMLSQNLGNILYPKSRGGASTIRQKRNARSSSFRRNR